MHATPPRPASRLPAPTPKSQRHNPSQTNNPSQIIKSGVVCVFQVSRPHLGLRPNPKHSTANRKQNAASPTPNIPLQTESKTLPAPLEKCIERCNFYIKYFDKIKPHANRPYPVPSKLKPETHIYFFFCLITRIKAPNH